MPAGPSLTWELPIAAFGHAVLFAIVMVAKCSSTEEPLFKPQDTIQVALAGPPKNVTRLPQKAERAPEAPKAAAMDAKAEPPPPNASDMAFKTPEAPKTKGDPTADARQKAIDDLKRRQAMQDLSAPIGKEDRLASNPDGTEGSAGSAATDGLSDPALARWIDDAKNRIAANWHPIRAHLENGSLVVVIRIEVDGSGKVVSTPTVKKSSGIRSFDESARAAAEATLQLKPLPAAYADGQAFAITFTPEDAK